MSKLEKALQRLNFLPLPTKELREFAQTQAIFSDGKLTVNQLEQLLRMLDHHAHVIRKRAAEEFCTVGEIWSDKDQCFYEVYKQHQN